MLNDRIEAKWIDCFEHVLRLCRLNQGDVVAILSETQSRPLNVHLAELALFRLGARPFHLSIPTPRQTAPAPVRDTAGSLVAGVPDAVLVQTIGRTAVVYRPHPEHPEIRLPHPRKRG